MLEFIQNNTSSFSLKPTQQKICIPVVNRICKKMPGGVRFSDIKIIKAEALIINGHHRYLASVLANYAIEHTEWQAPRNVSSADWALIEYVDDDWDSVEDIERLNLEDAWYNGIPLEEMIKMIS